jgi:ABC-2 type transport system permease protein
MSIPLFKATLKSNWLILLIFIVLLFVYMGTFVGMYDPESTASMEEFMKMLPEGMIKAMGIGETPADLTGFLGNYFYGMIVYLIPLIYVVITGNRLMARHVDNGSMAYLLSTPTTRVKIALTQGLYFLKGVAVMFVLLTGVTIAMCEAAHPGMLDIPAFIGLNAAALLMSCAISAICWLFSCLFNEARYSLALGAGIPVLFYMLKIVGGVSEELSWVSKLSLYDLFNASDILSGKNIMGPCVIFTVLTLALYTGGIWIFKRKRLPI